MTDGGGAEKKTNILTHESVRLDTRKNFFTVRVVKEWNSLPEELRRKPNVNSFKNAYDDLKNTQRERDEDRRRREGQ